MAALSRRSISVLAEAYELDPSDVVADERTSAAWVEPRDDLVVWMSRRHAWTAEQSVAYLNSLKQRQLP